MSRIRPACVELKASSVSKFSHLQIILEVNYSYEQRPCSKTKNIYTEAIWYELIRAWKTESELTMGRRELLK